MPQTRSFLRFSCLLICLLALSRASFAHAVLVTSTPAAKQVLASGDVPIELDFNSRIDGGRSHLSLTGPDGKDIALTPTKQPRPQTLTSTAPHLAAGAYTLHWVVLANDGHITKGEIPFTVQAKK